MTAGVRGHNDQEITSRRQVANGHRLGVQEHTIRIARDNGFWAGLTIYPVSKVTPQRGADLLEQFGPEMMCVNSASDWGESGPHMLIDTALDFARRAPDSLRNGTPVQRRQIVQTIGSNWQVGGRKALYSAKTPFSTIVDFGW